MGKPFRRHPALPMGYTPTPPQARYTASTLAQALRLSPMDSGCPVRHERSHRFRRADRLTHATSSHKPSSSGWGVVTSRRPTAKASERLAIPWQCRAPARIHFVLRDRSHALRGHHPDTVDFFENIGVRCGSFRTLPPPAGHLRLAGVQKADVTHDEHRTSALFSLPILHAFSADDAFGGTRHLSSGSPQFLKKSIGNINILHHRRTGRIWNLGAL